MLCRNYSCIRTRSYCCNICFDNEYDGIRVEKRELEPEPSYSMDPLRIILVPSSTEVASAFPRPESRYLVLCCYSGRKKRNRTRHSSSRSVDRSFAYFLSSGTKKPISTLSVSA